MSSPRRMLWNVVLCAGPMALLAAGCGETGPKAYSVSGKIVFKGGKGNLRQLAGGKVRFQSISDPSITPVGAIEDDGSFSMGSIVNEKPLPGVPAGAYKARVEPRADDEEGASQRTPIHAKYLDFNKSGLSFTVPGTGEILIEVEKPR